ncbi:MAG: DMT family transporter [Rhodospirillales bacterium]|nr:DMT family transporter [Rhodospirillales bacterium]MDH3918639.1 DMT family transporter [Rhodospirillales bacterium]MDH3966881.1 DMT family transporter [Rhodospirillales bacterium]
MASLDLSPAGPAAARRGILWMLLTTLFFVSMDALAKHLSQSYPVPQVVWARYVFHVLLLALLLGGRVRGVMRTGRLGLQLLRSLFLLGATGAFFTALSFIPLAEASAIMFVAPILVTALSMPLLREHVGPRRWASVVVGFGGALIIIRPGGDAMELTALFALGGATSYAFYQITTRLLSRSDGALTTLAYSALVGALASSAVVPFFWVQPDLAGWVGMVGLGLFGGIGHFALIKAFQAAPAATVTPFGYAALIWATLYGFVLFGDLPDLWTVVGAAIIATSGLYIFHREHAARRSG